MALVQLVDRPEVTGEPTEAVDQGNQPKKTKGAPKAKKAAPAESSGE
jgi:hypothetical protein